MTEDQTAASTEGPETFPLSLAGQVTQLEQRARTAEQRAEEAEAGRRKAREALDPIRNTLDLALHYLAEAGRGVQAEQLRASAHEFGNFAMHRLVTEDYAARNTKRAVEQANQAIHDRLEKTREQLEAARQRLRVTERDNERLEVERDAARDLLLELEAARDIDGDAAELAPGQQTAPPVCTYVSGDYGVRCQRDADHDGQHRHDAGETGVSWDDVTDPPPSPRQLVTRAMNAAGIDARAETPDYRLCEFVADTWQGRLLLEWAERGSPFTIAPDDQAGAAAADDVLDAVACGSWCVVAGVRAECTEPDQHDGPHVAAERPEVVWR